MLAVQYIFLQNLNIFHNLGKTVKVNDKGFRKAEPFAVNIPIHTKNRKECYYEKKKQLR